MQNDFMHTNKYIVITSINNFSEVLEKYASMDGWKLILVGDRKGPEQIEDDRIIFLDIESQAKLGFAHYAYCPENHYARKNLGYLYAIAGGAEIIAETDDDNIPQKGWGEGISFKCDQLDVFDNTEFFNVYSEFHNSIVWPRGFPLEKILDARKARKLIQSADIGVWQFLADNDPDVDAIFRLTRNEFVRFGKRQRLALAKNVYCPFNSQNTFWSRRAFPYMYLPSSVTFRFTDILRSYIAQRLLWEDDLLLGFGGASTWQDRNPHNLMQDFLEEIPMYLNVIAIVKKLNSLKMQGTPLENLAHIYQVLVDEQIVKQSELQTLKSWSDDLRRYGFE
jgi:hypothetical protein